MAAENELKEEVEAYSCKVKAFQEDFARLQKYFLTSLTEGLGDIDFNNVIDELELLFPVMI